MAILEMERVGDLVVQQVLKPDGSLVRIQYGKPGDACGMVLAASLDEAKKAIAPLVTKTIDRAGDLLIQKITKNDVLVHYQHGSEATGFTHVKTLIEARNAIKKVPA